jgi:membrane protein YdbS with pleckstrin-like domain
MIIKEGPLVLLYRLIAAELVTASLLFASSFLENYELFFKVHLQNFFERYDIFLVLLFSLLQLGLLIIVFLGWYVERYEMNDIDIIHRSGLLWRRVDMYPVASIISVSLSQSLLERFMRHATIILTLTSVGNSHKHNKRGSRTVSIRNIEDYETWMARIRHAVERREQDHTARPILNIMKAGEGDDIEFKQTLRYDVRNRVISKDVERAVMKTIVGFLNARGGTLVIGVNDEGKPVGLADDYNSLPRKNRDGFENHFTALVKAMMGIYYRAFVHVRFEIVKSESGAELEVCVVDILPSNKPAFLKHDGKEEFYVRTGNATSPFSMSEMEEYVKERWGK